MSDKQPYCTNSRRWLGFLGNNPGSCPHGVNGWGNCGPGCIYYEERKPTAYFRKKERSIREIVAWWTGDTETP